MQVYLVTDFEMNPIERGRRPEGSKLTQEITQIGAVAIDGTGKELASYSAYVRPTLAAGLDAGVSRLTGITEETLEGADEFAAAMAKFGAWASGFGEGARFVQWSGSDERQAAREAEAKGVDLAAAGIGRGWIDAQKAYGDAVGFWKKTSLSLAQELAGEEASGRAHDALDDARDEAALFAATLDEAKREEKFGAIARATKSTPIGTSLGALVASAVAGSGAGGRRAKAGKKKKAR